MDGVAAMTIINPDHPLYWVEGRSYTQDPLPPTDEINTIFVDSDTPPGAGLYCVVWNGEQWVRFQYSSIGQPLERILKMEQDIKELRAGIGILHDENKELKQQIKDLKSAKNRHERMIGRLASRPV